MEMKTLRFFGMLLVAVVISFGMTACGGDDDDDTGGGATTATFSIVGTWRQYFQSNDSIRGQVYNQWTFKSDHTGTLVEEVGYGSDTPEPFKWEQTNSAVNITLADENTITARIIEVVDSKTVVINYGQGNQTLYKQ